MQVKGECWGGEAVVNGEKTMVGVTVTYLGGGEKSRKK